MQIDVSFAEKRIQSREGPRVRLRRRQVRIKREGRMEYKCVLKSYHTLIGPSREWKQGEFNCRRKETQSLPRLGFRPRYVDHEFFSLTESNTRDIRIYINTVRFVANNSNSQSSRQHYFLSLQLFYSFI